MRINEPDEVPQLEVKDARAQGWKERKQTRAGGDAGRRPPDTPLWKHRLAAISNTDDDLIAGGRRSPRSATWPRRRD